MKIRKTSVLIPDCETIYTVVHFSFININLKRLDVSRNFERSDDTKFLTLK